MLTPPERLERVPEGRASPGRASKLRGRRTRAPERPSGQAGLPEPRSGDQDSVCCPTTGASASPGGRVARTGFGLRALCLHTRL